MRRALAASAAVLFAHCSGADDRAESRIKWLRDYSYVPVVENSGTPLATRINIGHAPIVIGEASGGDLSVVAHVKRLGTGEILILDTVNRNIVVYSAEGTLLRRIERRGDGPGEYQHLRGIYVAKGDTIVVFAPPNRLIRLLANGQYVDQKRVRDPTAARPVGRDYRAALQSRDSTGLWYPSQPLGNGTVLAIMRTTPPRLGYSRPQQLYGLVHAGDTLTIDTIGWFPGNEVHRVSERQSRTVHFSPMTHVAVGKQYIYFGDSGEYEIGQYDLGGRLIRRIRRQAQAAALPSADLRALETYLQSRGVRGGQDLEITKTQPFYYQILADDRDYLWVHESHADNARSQLWAVFDTAGRVVGEYSLPVPFWYRVVLVDSANIIVQVPRTLTPELAIYQLTSQQ